MKAFTDINQSKKLAEILPLESADIVWVYSAFEDDYFPHFRWFGKIVTGAKDIKAWSLAALLNILPSATLDSSDDHHYRLHCNEKFTDWYDNPIDCCIAMIDRLHEQMIYDFNNS